MFLMKGTDQFDGCFDFFKWSAPVYETPMEVVEALGKIDFSNKKIEKIRCIGAAEIDGLDSPKLYSAIKNAGIEPGDYWWENYPHLSDIPIDRKAILFEPVQFVFSDGSTFEFLPMEDGGARFSENAIPQDISDGLNQCNIDFNSFMGEEIAGKIISSCEMKVIRTEDESVTYPSCVNTKKPHTVTHTNYRYIFSLEYPLDIIIQMSWPSNYSLELDKYFACNTISYQKAQECVRRVNQVCIAPGKDSGGVFLIIPTHSGEDIFGGKHGLSRYANYVTSVDEAYIYEFLSVFLLEHYEAGLQDGFRDVEGFDWNGINLYSRESVLQILSEIKRTVDLLKTDFDHPELTKIKERFHPNTFSENTGNNLSEEEKNRLFSENRDLAVDFYTRFVNRIETVLAELPDCDVISFAGP